MSPEYKFRSVEYSDGYVAESTCRMEHRPTKQFDNVVNFKRRIPKRDGIHPLIEITINHEVRNTLIGRNRV